MDIGDLELLGIASGENSVIEREGAKNYYVTAIYRSQSYSGVPLANAESLAVGFFSLDALPHPLSQAVIGVLTHLEGAA